MKAVCFKVQTGWHQLEYKGVVVAIKERLPKQWFYYFGATSYGSFEYMKDAKKDAIKKIATHSQKTKIHNL